MATYTFKAVPAWGSVGQFARIGTKKSATFPCTLPGGGDATVVQDGTTKVGYLESDANGLIPDWTTTDIPSVDIDFGVAVLRVNSEDAITSGAASAAAAADSATAAENAQTAAESARDDAVAATAGKANLTGVPVSVLDHGAKGDGTTDDTAEINAAIVAGAGRTVYLPAGTYLIDATAGIKMWTAGVRLLLDPGATIKAAPNSADGYSMVEVNAADCVIEGGTIEGDGTGHTGSTGEQGHCITTAAGATRLRIQGVKVTKAWGDGIAIQGGAADVAVIDCTADDNRRQGLSVIEAVRPRILGGVYMNTGLSQFTSPGAGIDVEPNAGNTVSDCQITGVTFSGNKGPGLQIASVTGSTVEVTVAAGTSTGSTGDGTTANGYGFYAVGAAGTIKAKVTGLRCSGNALHGFQLSTEGVELVGCTSRGNTQHGFTISASESTLTGCRSIENGRVGFQVPASTILNTNLVSCTAKSNSQTTSGAYAQFDNSGVGTRMSSCVSDAGTLTNKPAYGYLLRASSTARLLGCDVRGTFTAANYSDGSGAGNSPAFPVPGVAKQTLSAAATDAATTQTLANSLRSALIALGYGA